MQTVVMLSVIMFSVVAPADKKEMTECLSTIWEMPHKQKNSISKPRMPNDLRQKCFLFKSQIKGVIMMQFGKPKHHCQNDKSQMLKIGLLNG
jgi:hypothetical protein